MTPQWITHLDAYGMGNPDNREGHPEDVCTVCDRRIVDHPGCEQAGVGDGSARWPHRIYAAATRLYERLWWMA